MSSKTRRPNALDRLVTKRDLLHVITAMNQATRALEERIEALELPRLPVTKELEGGYLRCAERTADDGRIEALEAKRETPA